METNVGWPKRVDFLLVFWGKGSMGINLSDTQVDIHLARYQL
jgi:hypothetical protein